MVRRWSGSAPPSADFMLRTGRMPLPAPDAPMVASRPGVRRRTDPGARRLRRLPGRWPARSRTCRSPGPILPRAATCSSRRAPRATAPGAGGDSVGGGFVAPPLLGIDPVIVGEAIRTGPGAMPVFGPGQISDADLGDDRCVSDLPRGGRRARRATFGGARAGRRGLRCMDRRHGPVVAGRSPDRASGRHDDASASDGWSASSRRRSP